MNRGDWRREPMRKLLVMVTLAGAALLAWRAWQQKQENAEAWASAADRVR